MQTPKVGTRQGFTLIELLVVIAIIAILAAILFPVFAKARSKARQITCISNQKQLGTAFMMYFQDYDEKAPFFRVVMNGGDWWSSRMMNWKDLVYPYIKNGGRPYNNGIPYPDKGNGGAMMCPENSAVWSTADVWWSVPHPGDETTRFPRSYAVNSDAGVNENGPSNGGHFWPCVGDGSCDRNSGALASLQTPAGTIMVTETRLPFPDIKAEFGTYTVQSNGQPWGGTPYSAIQGHGGGFTNFIFFDGHAKTTRMSQAYSSDLWDCYAATGYGTGNSYGQQGWAIANINNVKEWSPGL